MSNDKVQMPNEAQNSNDPKRRRKSSAFWIGHLDLI
jgi:hypothetical protein